jgi:hypothetical protein
MRHAILLSLAGVLLSSAALANPAPAAEPRQARIPFANSGGISGWQSAGRSAILLEGVGRKWYRAEVIGYCRDLDIATTIGFDANANGDFDSFSSLIVRGQRCPLKSLVETAPPARKPKKAKS